MLDVENINTNLNIHYKQERKFPYVYCKNNIVNIVNVIIITGSFRVTYNATYVNSSLRKIY